MKSDEPIRILMKVVQNEEQSQKLDAKRMEFVASLRPNRFPDDECRRFMEMLFASNHEPETIIHDLVNDGICTDQYVTLCSDTILCKDNEEAFRFKKKRQ